MGCYYEITKLIEDTKIHKNLKNKREDNGRMEYHHDILFTSEKLSKAKLVFKREQRKSKYCCVRDAKFFFFFFKERTLKTSQKPLMIRKQDVFMTAHEDMKATDILRTTGGSRVLLHDLTGLPLPVQMQAV